MKTLAQKAIQSCVVNAYLNIRRNRKLMESYKKVSKFSPSKDIVHGATITGRLNQSEETLADVKKSLKRLGIKSWRAL
jgi:hypothetical protein